MCFPSGKLIHGGRDSTVASVCLNIGDTASATLLSIENDVSCRRGAEGIQTQTGGPVMIRVELDPDEAAVEFSGGRKGGTGRRKWVTHGVARFAEGLDQRFEDADRFVRRVQAVAGILPVEHVRRLPVGEGGKALGQQI